MKTYHNHRQEPYYTYLKKGLKTIEGRLQKGWYTKVKPGDHIHVFNEDETDSITTEVLAVRKYPSIKNMLQVEDINKLLPDVRSISEGIAVYRKFYDEESEKKHGAVAIEVIRLHE